MSDPAVKLEALAIGTKRGEPMRHDLVAKDLETMAAKIREVGSPVHFSLKVRWS